jgi:EAL domain-containing protein (putative c-di-GMP-specific phosphodiesterase class I)
MNFHPTLPSPLGTVLQTIVDTTGDTPSVFAVECLTRGPRGSKLEQAPPLFDYIRRRGLETEMDCDVVGRALRAAAGRAPRITLNVHPSTLADHGKFVRCLIRQTELAGIEPSSVIVEVGEQTPASDPAAFAEALRELRARGFAIAVDDVGFGYANYKSILDCQPDYLKIDRHFVHGVSSDPGKAAVIRSILALAEFFHARVIAEGVEKEQDHELLKDLGIELFQGFLFSRPEAVDGGHAILTVRTGGIACPPLTRWGGAFARRQDSGERRGLLAAARRYRDRSRARA